MLIENKVKHGSLNEASELRTDLKQLKREVRAFITIINGYLNTEECEDSTEMCPIATS